MPLTDLEIRPAVSTVFPRGAHIMRFGKFGKGDRLSRRRLKTWLHLGCLAVVAGGFLTAFIWDNSAVGQAAGKTAVDAPAAATRRPSTKECDCFEPSVEQRKIPHRRAGGPDRRTAGGRGGTALRPHVGQAGEGGRPGHAQDAGDRRGRPRRGQRLSGGAVQEDRPADYHHHGRLVLHEIQSEPSAGHCLRLRPRRRLPARLAV